MKPSYKGFEAKKSGGFIELPPVGAYVGEILNVEFLPKDGDKQFRDAIRLYIDITEGEYKGRFMEVWNDQKERFGDKVAYKGIFNLMPPTEGDEDWRKRVFEGNLWCVEQNNPGYAWDWHEEKLKGKKIGFSVRRKLYTYKDKKTDEIKEGQTMEIAKFETIDDVRNGKCKPMNDRDTRDKDALESSTDGSNFTEVSTTVEVPWG